MVQPGAGRRLQARHHGPALLVHHSVLIGSAGRPGSTPVVLAMSVQFGELLLLRRPDLRCQGRVPPAGGAAGRSCADAGARQIKPTAKYAATWPLIICSLHVGDHTPGGFIGIPRTMRTATPAFARSPQTAC